MNKHRYQARELQRVDWGQLGEAVRGQRLIFAVDVAKTSFYGVLMSGAREALLTVRWHHPTETMALSEAEFGGQCTQIQCAARNKRLPGFSS